MFRDDLQKLKAQKDDEVRLDRIDKFVSNIYTSAVNAATTSSETPFHYMIPSNFDTQPDSRFKMTNMIHISFTDHNTDPFYIQNMPDILEGLKILFPDSLVTHSIMSKGIDGNLYDISKLDSKTLPFVNQVLNRSYIVIDWS